MIFFSREKFPLLNFMEFQTVSLDLDFLGKFSSDFDTFRLDFRSFFSEEKFPLMNFMEFKQFHLMRVATLSGNSLELIARSQRSPSHKYTMNYYLKN